MVKGIFENESAHFVVVQMVIDDDASTRALLSSEEREYEQSGIQIHTQRQDILSNYVTDVKSMYSCWRGQCGSRAIITMNAHLAKWR
jgi:hypothetical protein